jgi:hypothetical protein
MFMSLVPWILPARAEYAGVRAESHAHFPLATSNFPPSSFIFVRNTPWGRVSEENVCPAAPAASVWF